MLLEHPVPKNGSIATQGPPRIIMACVCCTFARKGGEMHLAYPTYTERCEEVEQKILHLSLPGLLPEDSTLALNRETRTLCLLREGPQLITEQQFSFNEMCMLLPILESFPHYCPYEVLLSHIYSTVVTVSSIDNHRQRLQEAQSQGTWQQELRPIRRALSSLRTKLHHFNLEVSNIRERGCSITSLISTSSVLRRLGS